jgi:hypothetical protein
VMYRCAWQMNLIKLYICFRALEALKKGRRSVPTPCASTLHHTRSDQTSCTCFCRGCRPYLVEYRPLKSVPPHPSSLPSSLVILLACNFQQGNSDPAWELRSNIPRCILDFSTRRAAKRSMSLQTDRWRLPEFAPGCPLLSIWRPSLPRPRCACQGQGQITDHPFVLPQDRFRD